MISIDDYAKQHGISYEAVRKQVKRYAEELDGHISKVNRKQYLDDEAVAFLDEKRNANPIIVQQMDKDEELERLQNENKVLLIKIAEIQEETNGLYKRLDQQNTAQMAALEAKTQLLLETNEEIQQLKNEKISLIEEKANMDAKIQQLEAEKQAAITAAATRIKQLESEKEAAIFEIENEKQNLEQQLLLLTAEAEKLRSKAKQGLFSRLFHKFNE